VDKYLSYNPDTGLFTRIYSATRKDLIGNIAGCKNTDGYIVIRLKDKDHLAHRLAWIFTYGEIPDGLFIDHIDGDKSNNRISNLRLCKNNENMQNIKRSHKDNLTGLLGVTKHGKGYLAQISRMGKKRSKWFKSKEEAHEFYLKLKRDIHEFNTI